MDPVSNSDRLVRLLRQKLDEREKSRAPDKRGRVGPVEHNARPDIRAIAGDMARGGGSEALLRRALIEQLLTDQFDGRLANDAKFQQIVDRVTAIMADDPEVGGLLNAVVSELFADGRLS